MAETKQQQNWAELSDDEHEEQGVVKKEIKKEVKKQEEQDVNNNQEDQQERPQKKYNKEREEGKPRVNWKGELIDAIKASDDPTVYIVFFKCEPAIKAKDIYESYKDVKIKNIVKSGAAAFTLEFDNHNDAIHMVKVGTREIAGRRPIMKLSERVPQQMENSGWNEMGYGGKVEKPFQSYKHVDRQPKNKPKTYNRKEGDSGYQDSPSKFTRGGQKIERQHNEEGQEEKTEQKTEQLHQEGNDDQEKTNEQKEQEREERRQQRQKNFQQKKAERDQANEEIFNAKFKHKSNDEEGQQPGEYKKIGFKKAPEVKNDSKQEETRQVKNDDGFQQAGKNQNKGKQQEQQQPRREEKKQVQEPEQEKQEEKQENDGWNTVTISQPKKKKQQQQQEEDENRKKNKNKGPQKKQNTFDALQ